MGLSAPAPLGRRRRRGGVFRVAQLFANGEAGAVYDPSDLTAEKVAWALANPGFTSAQFLAAFPTHTLFQDSAGTTPVTALGQPVGLVLDTSGRGNHAIQATSASRPLLDARVNLLTYSDEFNNAIWTKISSAVTANTTVAPDGTTTADTLTASAGSGFHYLNTGPAFLSASYTYTLHVKKGTSRWIFFGLTDSTLNYFDLDTGSFGTTSATCAATNLSNGWWRLTATAIQTAGAASGCNVGLASGNDGGSFTATGTETVIIWRSDLRLTSDIAYPPQRVAAATDYADVGVPRSFLFDGVDDFLVTAANMDLSGTDKVTVLSGVRKNSDAALAMVCEHSSASTTAVLFAVFAPRTNATANYSFRSRGTTTTVDATSPSTFAAPDTHVLTGQADIGAPLTSLRINGTEQASSATVQGATNYRADLLYIGRRFNATIPYNGKLYQLIVRGAATDTGTLTQAERYVAQRTGITL